MNNNFIFRRPFIKRAILSFLLVSAVFFYDDQAYAGPYLDSAHGDAASGVKRSASGFPADYPTGHCAHCHEQHAKINGFEPAPSGGPDDYLLFDENHSSQTVNFCFDCHTGVSSYQTGGSITNRSYSFRAGAWTADPLDDILEAFSYSSPGTSHDLDDIMTFITGKWSYTANSNPCAACHNPHSAQGDPENSDTAKSAGSRGWPVSRPSMHSKDNNAWGLWGDDAATERMNAANYQAPYRYYTVTPSTLEPQGDPIADPVTAAQSTTDFVTFCNDCHNHPTDTIFSTRLARPLTKIDWSSSGDKHGEKASRDVTYNKGTITLPYVEASATNYVLSCLDCHEPHGSQNAFLLRTEVNGIVLSGAIAAGDNSNGAWTEFCEACHNVTVTGVGDPCDGGHGPGSWPNKACYDCHKHSFYRCPVNSSL